MLDRAPYFADIADGPEGGAAYWLTTRDGLRIRIGVWTSDAATKGTVLLFPGRTEYIEKYGPAAVDLLARGYAVVAVDWRGQGLADRLLDDPQRGHVDHFHDYQHDVAAMVAALDQLSLPGPHFLIAHSMGGCIGLRSLIEGLDVRAAVFSAPMWDIRIFPLIRPFARVLGWQFRCLGFGRSYAPGSTGRRSYAATQPFKGNALSTDHEMYAHMQNQLKARPELALGGPTVTWVHEALRECVALSALPSPDCPTLTFLGGAENIVCSVASRDRMNRWPRGQLIELPGARHEVMMETPQTRARFFDETCALFDANRD
ncbi:alpha/beta fold hydrolase [Actibacterium sp.]|uniref:alpha/beta fold hydrolase n=1 Tax=Actibacterium sp. TaxID=1872125 RepID=UPI0035664AB1